VDARNTRNATALLRTCFFGHTEVARYLLKKGADVNAYQTGGRTPLICATYARAHELMALLLERGADVEVRWRPNDGRQAGRGGRGITGRGEPGVG
jgi:ankyrin repeat protein